ncbi:MAG: NAD(P)/FAD-dependent oxidoreductase [Phototrophicaceae bacterium]
MAHEAYDVIIVGGGPAGLQSALMLARTRKKILVFDAPEAPRNGASHGVHNFVGLDGLLPSEIREQAWQQINVYNSAELRTEKVVNIQKTSHNDFLVISDSGDSTIGKHVILAIGFRDVYPDIEGFQDCWADTIIMCPFCDGYENRDRVWGLVISSQRALEHYPILYRNWTSEAKIILTSDVTIDDEHRDLLTQDAVSIHDGDIVKIDHISGKVQGVTLNTGEYVALGTLLWGLADKSLSLTDKVIENFNLDLHDTGYIKTDDFHQTSFNNLWAIGDIVGWAGSLGAAFAGHQTAVGIIKQWYE